MISWREQERAEQKERERTMLQLFRQYQSYVAVTDGGMEMIFLWEDMDDFLWR